MRVKKADLTIKELFAPRDWTVVPMDSSEVLAQRLQGFA
jgi:hypothetical protein